MASRDYIYQENILNSYDNYTYKWTMYMVHPQNAHRFEENIRKKQVVVLAESGVESEINIQSVQQNMVLAFKNNKDRNALANMFVFDLIEPGGATLFNRILLAAQKLKIQNHLHACYLLELRFVGYDSNGVATNNIVGPYYYMTSMSQLTFDYKEGATSYRADMIETHQDAYKTTNLHVKGQFTINNVNTFGQFLDQLQEKINEQSLSKTVLNRHQLLPTEYVLDARGDTAEWRNWKFGQAAQSGDTSLKSTSVSGDGTLTFTFKQGSAVNTAIVIALMQTVEFRKLPTFSGGFHKDNTDDGEAKAPTFSELSSWFVFDTDVEYKEYDELSKNYQQKITFFLKKFAATEVIHDPVSHQQMLGSSSIQVNRMKKIIKNGLLRKRFDYTLTGMNTEVLNLDVTLNNSYFQLQAINHGKLTNRSNALAGMSEEKQEINILKTDAQRMAKELSQLESQLSSAQKELEASNKLATGERELSQNDARDRISRLESEINIKKEEAANALNLATEALEEYSKRNTKTQRLPTVLQRYITQDDVALKNNSSDNPAILSFNEGPVTSTATVGADDGDTTSAVMLGAVELNLNTLSDLVQQQIQIRGDPYWLGKPKSASQRLQVTDRIDITDDKQSAPYQRGGLNYFLNLNFPTYPDQQTGLMDVSEQNFGIIGIYRVVRVDASYSDGQFIMTLDAFRDTSTNVGLTIDILEKGFIDTAETKTQAERFTDEADAQEPDPENDVLSNEPGGDETAPPASADGTGVVTESQASVAATRKLPIDSELKSILANAGAAAGVNVDVRSGGQDSSTGFTGSSRHNNGMAADVALRDSTGRRLSLDNPADVPIIQNFIAQTKRYGATGIGAGNGYMGDDTFHIDIADSVGQGAPGYWGGPLDNGTFRARNAPPWLRDIFTG